LSRKLGTIIRNLNCCGEITELKRKEINKTELLSVFRKLEFGSLISRMNLLAEEEKSESAIDLKIIYIKSIADLKNIFCLLLK
jgi:DNA polymerase-1